MKMGGGGADHQKGWNILCYVDPVKLLLGQLNAFPQAFYFIVIFFLQQRLTEPILANFGLKSFQPKQRKADLYRSYEPGHFVMRRHEVPR